MICWGRRSELIALERRRVRADEAIERRLAALEAMEAEMLEVLRRGGGSPGPKGSVTINVGPVTDIFPTTNQ